EELVSHYQATGVEYAFYPRQGVGHGGWDIPVEGRDLDEISFEFVVETQGLSVL
ncbi:MAG: esterase, partial [Acidimicrobiaceae bacterium]|nr:esterase [Acidimicrobiaceae bacterium]